MPDRNSAAQSCLARPARSWTRSPRLPQIGIRASANMWRNPMTSVPADGEAILSAGRPIVRRTYPYHTSLRCLECQLEIMATSNGSLSLRLLFIELFHSPDATKSYLSIDHP